MLRQLCLLALLCVAPQSWAGESTCADRLIEPGILRCTLSSGAWSATVRWDLADEDLEDAIGSIDEPGSRDHDLSIWLEATRAGVAWQANVMLSSAEIQDEYRSHGFGWNHGARGEVFKDLVEEAPDGKAYALECVVE